MRDLTEKARIRRLFQQGMGKKRPFFRALIKLTLLVSQPSKRVRETRRKSTFGKFKSSLYNFGSSVASRRQSCVPASLRSSGRSISSRLSVSRRSSSQSSRSSSGRRSFRIKRSARETVKVKSLTLTVDDACCSDEHIRYLPE